jgi:hypothetical protein
MKRLGILGVVMVCWGVVERFISSFVGINPDAMGYSSHLEDGYVLFVAVCVMLWLLLLYCRPGGMEMPDHRGADEGSKTLVPRGGSRLVVVVETLGV